MKLAKPYLEHILQECRFLIEKSEGLCFENFTKDPVLMRAFVRNLEIIGEAVKNLPEDFKKDIPKFPGKK